MLPSCTLVERRLTTGGRPGASGSPVGLRSSITTVFCPCLRGVRVTTSVRSPSRTVCTSVLRPGPSALATLGDWLTRKPVTIRAPARQSASAATARPRCDLAGSPEEPRVLGRRTNLFQAAIAIATATTATFASSSCPYVVPTRWSHEPTIRQASNQPVASRAARTPAAAVEKRARGKPCGRTTCSVGAGGCCRATTSLCFCMPRPDA